MAWQEMVMYVLVVVHILLWMYVYFAWMFRKNTHIVLLCILPLFFIVQSLPCHAIVYGKISFIRKNHCSLRSKDTYKLNSDDLHAISQLHKTLGWQRDDLIRVWKHLKYYEHAMIVPAWIDRAKTWCDKHCYTNPFSPQGMLVLAFIVNAYATYVKCYSSMHGTIAFK